MNVVGSLRALWAARGDDLLWIFLLPLAMLWFALYPCLYLGTNRGATEDYWKHDKHGLDYLYYPVKRAWIMRDVASPEELRSQRRQRVLWIVGAIGFASFVIVLWVDVVRTVIWPALTSSSG